MALWCFRAVMIGAAAMVGAAIASGPAAAEDISVREAGERSYLFLGAGYDDFADRDSPAAGFQIEGAYKELFNAEAEYFGVLTRLRPRAAAEFSSDGDVFAGAGLSLETFFFDSPFFFEVSFLPGVYSRPDQFFPIEFRTQLGLGYQFENGHTVTVTASHKSNNKHGPEGSSVETLLLRYGVPFSVFK